jgi:alpha-tubulin suppressor-like RCC1 family protein
MAAMLLATLLSACGDRHSNGGEQFGEVLAATQISSGVTSVCAVTVGDRLACWGLNRDGELGDGTLEERTFPVAIDLDHVVEIDLAPHRSCARTGDGRLYCWGRGERGQIGDGIAQDGHVQLVPTEVHGLADVVDVSVSDWTTCAVLDDGSVWCWGYNKHHALGFPSESCGPYNSPYEAEVYVPCASEPVQVPGLVDAVEVSIERSHQCARHRDGTVSCWGISNDYGTLGDGTTTSPATVEPRPVIGLSNVVQLGVGNLASCALVDDGSVWCWGDNRKGMLGLGLTEDELEYSAEPVKVPTLANITRLSVNHPNVCAITKSGELYCWGWALPFHDWIEPDGFRSEEISSKETSPVAVLHFGVPAVDVDPAPMTGCILDVENHVRCLGQQTANGSAYANSGDPVVWED